MNKPLGDVQLQFATSLLHVNTERQLLGSLVGDEAKNRNRVAQYRANLWRTWHKVLASAYPLVRTLLGDDFFLTLSCEYGTADPARSGDFNQFGSRMAELLEAWPPTAAYRYLTDVARLEWLVHRAYFADDVATQSPEQWVQRAPETLKSYPIQLHPAVQLLHTSTRAADRWLTFRASGEKPILSDVERPQWMVVARPRWIPEVVVVSPNAFAMLVELRNGAKIAEARDAALARDCNFDFEHNWQTWIEHGIVIAS